MGLWKFLTLVRLLEIDIYYGLCFNMYAFAHNRLFKSCLILLHIVSQARGRLHVLDLVGVLVCGCCLS
jgi:hypothetical protein